MTHDQLAIASIALTKFPLRATSRKTSIERQLIFMSEKIAARSIARNINIYIYIKYINIFLYYN